MRVSTADLHMATLRGSTTASSIERGQHPRTQDTRLSRGFRRCIWWWRCSLIAFPNPNSNWNPNPNGADWNWNWNQVLLNYTDGQRLRLEWRTWHMRLTGSSCCAAVAATVAVAVSVPPACCLPCCRCCYCCWSACLAVIVVLINELDGSLRNQLVCSLAFVSSRLAFKICCSTWAWISSWYLGACIAYRVSCISQTIFALWLPSLLAATASRPDNHNILRQLPLAVKVTWAVESSVLNVNRGNLSVARPHPQLRRSEIKYTALYWKMFYL